MAQYYIVSKDSIDASADAIRSKTGSQSAIEWDGNEGFADAITAISGSGITPTGTKQISITQNGTTTEDVTNYANAEITVNVATYCTANGVPYTKEVELPQIYLGTSLLNGATELETVVCNDTRAIGSASARITYYFNGCTKLKSVNFPYLQSIGESFIEYFLGNCTALETATFGSIGYPISAFANTSYNKKLFQDTTQNTLTITLYVNAQSISEVPAEITTQAPWGATGATIVYKNYLTGAVLT